MDIAFDSAKDAANIDKHGVSLTEAVELDVRVVVEDGGFAEPRLRAYGYLRGEVFCLAYTLRGDTLRAISFRRAHAKEFRRYGL